MQSPRITIPAPGPRWISFITLLLRATVGLQLFRIAISSYLARVAYGQSQRTQAFLLPPTVPPLMTEVFQYVILVISVALILGFFTRFAAAGIGILLATAIVAQIVLELRAGVPIGLTSNPILALDDFNMIQMRQHIVIQLVVILWFSGASTNLYSLDGLMFLKKQRNEKPRPNNAPTSPLLTGGQPRPNQNQDTGTKSPKDIKAWVARELDYYKSDTGASSTKPGQSS